MLIHTEQSVKCLSLDQLRKLLIERGIRDTGVNYYNPACHMRMRELILENQKKQHNTNLNTLSYGKKI